MNNVAVWLLTMIISSSQMITPDYAIPAQEHGTPDVSLSYTEDVSMERVQNDDAETGSEIIAAISAGEYIDAILGFEDELIFKTFGIKPEPCQRTKLRWTNDKTIEIRTDTRALLTDNIASLTSIAPDLTTPLTYNQAAVFANLAISRWKLYFLSGASGASGAKSPKIKGGDEWVDYYKIDPNILAGLTGGKGYFDPAKTVSDADFDNFLEFLRQNARAKTYAKLTKTNSYQVDNGDGTSTYFILDPSTPDNQLILFFPESYLLVYKESDTLMRDFKEDIYRRPDKDLIILLHWVDLDRFYPINVSDGTSPQYLTVSSALTQAGQFFPTPSNKPSEKCIGWYQWWGYDTVYGIISLRMQQFEAGVTSHELMHRSTNLDLIFSEEDRERIATEVSARLAIKENTYMALCIPIEQRL